MAARSAHASSMSPEGLWGYRVGDGVERAVHAAPYRRAAHDPPSRRIRVFVLDPAASKLEGATALLDVPFERFRAVDGRVFVGDMFECDWVAGAPGRVEAVPNPDDPAFLTTDGRNADQSDPLFRRQMVYAICSLVYSVFRSALGRDLAWGFGPEGTEGRTRLLLRPDAGEFANAYYERHTGSLQFGFFRASERVAGRSLPGGWVYTSLSHDIVVHELTHALIDGLRSSFLIPSRNDVLAFHEGFADLVAVFQRFTYPAIVESALAGARGKIENASLLTDIARQFAQSGGTGNGRQAALRSALDIGKGQPRVYRADMEPHELGSVLVSAIFSAFATVFRRKTARFVNLATNGGSRPLVLNAELNALLAEEARSLATRFLHLCIRALDYCPPVDIELGEFLRAIVTADSDLVREDPYAFREACIDGFWQREIYPPNVESLSEEALRWKGPERPIPPIRDLTFAALKFAGDPARASGRKELRRQAEALARVAVEPANLKMFGLAAPGDPALQGDDVSKPTIESIRTSRRIGPDGCVLFDLVAEVTQVRYSRDGQGPRVPFLGGATVVIGPDGTIRYLIAKSVASAERLKKQRDYILKRGAVHWLNVNGELTPKKDFLRQLHEPAKKSREEAQRP